jgi:hypothetical protein
MARLGEGVEPGRGLRVLLRLVILYSKNGLSKKITIPPLEPAAGFLRVRIDGRK